MGRGWEHLDVRRGEGIDVTLAWFAAVFGEREAREVANIQGYQWKNDANWDIFRFTWGDGL